MREEEEGEEQKTKLEERRRETKGEGREKRKAQENAKKAKGGPAKEVDGVDLIPLHSELTLHLQHGCTHSVLVLI